jgi:hypothetical protein
MITRVVWNRLLAVICVAILGGILVFGLWPFTPHPKNDVAWMPNSTGLRFGEYGTILSAGIFRAGSSASGAPCSLEIWFKPGDPNDTNTMLAFYGPENLISFSLHQSIRDLVFRHQNLDRQNQLSESHIYLDDVLHPDTASFVTMTASPQGTAFYVDGALVKRSSDFIVSAGDFAGQLILGNSPVANDSWSGDLLGLAIYDRELSAAEVLEHSNSWTKNGRPAIQERGAPVALYLFDERAGTVIHNRAVSAPDLYIPDHYLIMHQTLLEVPWREFHPGWGYYQDALINIGGFIPFGFVFCAYFSSVRHLRRSIWTSIFLGFAVSLMIETLQGFIPTRDSSMTDVINNTLGTVIGAMLFRWKITQVIFSWVGIPIE